MLVLVGLIWLPSGITVLNDKKYNLADEQWGEEVQGELLIRLELSFKL
jgi:hypothetical protein